MSEQDEPSPKPKSMTEFDYFAEEAAANDVTRGEMSLAHLVRRRRRLKLHAALIAAVCVVLGYYVWGLHDTILYHFRNEPITELGRVDEKDPTTLPHDRFVRLSGITEARAAQVKWIRGLSWRQQYRYYHLLGTPVFIEVPAEEAKGNIDAFEEVKLDGRLIDLSKTNEYARLMSFLEERLFMRIPEHAFLLQVSAKPDGGKQAIVFLLAILLIPALNIVFLVRAYRRLTALPKPKV